MKNATALFLCVVILLSVLVFSGCTAGKDKNNDDTWDTSGTSTEPVSDVTTQGDGEPVFPDKNYKGSAYRILCTTQCEELYVTPEDTSLVINDATYKRNVAVEDKYGITLQFKALEGRSGGKDAFVTEIRTSSAAADACYDLVIGQTYYTMALALEGMYFNMAKSEYLNLGKPWYDGELVNDNINIEGKLFAVSGSYVISQITTAMGVYYNKDMYRNYGCMDIISGKDIYDVVREREWTFEKMADMTSLVYSDVNNNQQYDAADIYGFVGNTHAAMCAMVGSDTPIVIQDDEGNLSIDGYYNDHLISVFDTYSKFFNSEHTVYYVANDDGLIEFFANSQSLFCCHAVEYLAKGTLRDSGVDYGILPFPLFNAEQESYYTNNIRWEIAHIPVVCDTERSAIIFEFLNYTSYNIVIPAYFETVLKLQAVEVEDDSEMLTLIRSTVRFDMATFYQSQIGNSYSDNIYVGVKSLIRSGDTGIARWWEEKNGLFKLKFNDLIDTYKYYLE